MTGRAGIDPGDTELVPEADLPMGSRRALAEAVGFPEDYALTWAPLP